VREIQCQGCFQILPLLTESVHQVSESPDLHQSQHIQRSVKNY
jgi:hypothetical protein